MLFLDFRTKFYMTIMISTISISGGLSRSHPGISVFLYLVPILLLLQEKKWKASCYGLIFIGFGIMLNYFFFDSTIGFINTLILMITGIILGMLPGYLMAYYTYSSTSMSDLVESLRRIRLPDELIIPISVMFRFFGSISEDYNSVSIAMRMHDLTLKKHILSPLKYMELKLVPLLMVSIKTADDVAVSAMTRGLVVGGERSSLSKTKIRTIDWIVILIMSCIFVIFIKGSIL